MINRTTDTLSFSPISDDRGKLISLEAECDVPFPIRRVYYLYSTEIGVSRGNHAHRRLKQLMIAVHGSVNVRTECRLGVHETKLDKPNIGLYLEGLTWRTLYNFSKDAVILVLTDMPYDENDYFRSYEQFKDALNDRV